MPSGRDVGSEEAEISCSEWHFTHFKRFSKQPTTLTVHRPKPGSSPAAAHDKVNEILDTTVDRAFFDALKLLQSGVDPALTDLSAAAAPRGLWIEPPADHGRR